MSTPNDDSEVAAMAAAYSAIASQPQEAWPRMLKWLQSRMEADMRTKTNAIGESSRVR